MGKLKPMRVAAVCAALWSIAYAGPAAAQIKAFLPDVSAVAPGAPAAIDGIWKTSLNGVDFRIEAGRAYALASYLHLFVLEVQPGMVTTKNIRRLAAGVYEGYDMPSLGPWKAKLRPDNSLAVTVNGPLGPIPFTLAPIRIDDPDWLAREQAEMRGGGVAPRTVTNSGSIYPPGWDAHVR